MAIIKDGYGKSPAGETPQQRAARKWANNDIAKRFKEERALHKADAPEPAARVITSSDANVERQRAKRVKTTTELRKLVKTLKDIVVSGRNTVTLKAPELKGPKREITLAGYRSSLAHQKRRLLLEKLRRLEEAHQA